jgi:arylsulfatase A-like enzyme
MITRREFGTLLTGAACGAAFPAPAPGAAARPNLVVILADDLGYGDLGCYGHPTIRTPNLDRMAREGMRFTQFYSAAPVCTPSRAALLTGRLPARSGLTRVLNPKSTGGLAASEITVAELLKPLGYATAIVGKWHLGHLPQYLPTRHGFDSYFGIPYSNDMNPRPLLRDDKVIEEEPDQNYLTQRYTEEAARFIRASAKARKPFFLYLPHTFPHVPLHASPKVRGQSPRGLYGDVVEELDWSTGEVLRVLRESGVDRNTLVVFSSDNGPWLIKKQEGGSAGLLREGKSSTWEGGMREPFLARWPGRVPAGVVTQAFGTLMDLFPTAAKISGAAMPAGREYDGVDLSPVLFENSPGREPLHFYYNAETLCAVRRGPWKLHLTSNEPATGGGFLKHEPPLLYNLTVDPSEKYNVAAENPAVVQEVLAVIARHRQTFKFGELQR